MLTPKQKDMARHALGLPNKDKRSYRNRYVVSRENPDWKHLLSIGCATINTVGYVVPTAEFNLTKKGALAAIDPGESLDDEDFPGSHPNLKAEAET